jgi:hypothetical protein
VPPGVGDRTSGQGMRLRPTSGRIAVRRRDLVTTGHGRVPHQGQPVTDGVETPFVPVRIRPVHHRLRRPGAAGGADGRPRLREPAQLVVHVTLRLAGAVVGDSGDVTGRVIRVGVVLHDVRGGGVHPSRSAGAGQPVGALVPGQIPRHLRTGSTEQLLDQVTGLVITGAIDVRCPPSQIRRQPIRTPQRRVGRGQGFRRHPANGRQRHRLGPAGVGVGVAELVTTGQRPLHGRNRHRTPGRLIPAGVTILRYPRFHGAVVYLAPAGSRVLFVESA